MALVNDDVITDSDLQAYLKALPREGDAEAPREVSPAMRKTILQRMIEERLMLQDAKRVGVTVGTDEVAERLQMLLAHLETKEAYEQMLREADLSEEQLKSKLREQLLIQKVIDRAVRSKIVVSPSELAQLVGSSHNVSKPGEEVHLHHLLIRTTEQRSLEEAQALVTQLREQLLNGADFEAIAKDHSEDPYAQEGGAMGWVRLGELLPELSEAIGRLEPGQLSDPIHTRLGWHLIKIDQRRMVDAERGDARERPEQQLYQQKFSQTFSLWLNELRQRAYIQIVEE
ncbi:MAG: peptidylprolyl isomerase [Candidatus Omnitrophica bacterium]|nr:peptidylprolyl isomerase [Candidatus Omnitrophota bacterium]